MATPKVKVEITAVNRTRRAFQQVQRSLTRFASAARPATTIVGAAFGAVSAALLKLAGDAARPINALDDMARRLGSNAAALSEYAEAARLSGIETNQFTVALQRQTRRIAEAAAGYGEARGALAELGLDVQRLNQARPEQAFAQISEALEGVPNQADRIRLAFKLWDTEGVGLVQTLGQLRQNIEAVRATGGAVTQEELEAAREYRELIDRMRLAWQALTQWILTKLAPVLRWMNDTIENITGATISGFQESATAISTTADATENATSKVEDYIQALRRENELLGLQAQGFNEAADSFRRLDQARTAAGRELTDQESRQVIKLSIANTELNEKLQARAELLNRNRAFADRLASSMTSAFESAILNGERLQDVLEGLLKDLAALVIRTAILQPLAQAVAGGIPPVFGPSTTPARRLGGFVSGRRPYLVGENGPELFVPGQSGRVANGMNVTINNNAGVAVDTEPDAEGGVIINLIRNVVDEQLTVGKSGEAFAAQHALRRRGVTR